MTAILINLEQLKNSVDFATEKGHFQIHYAEFLMKSQIAIAERLEAILNELKNVKREV